MATKPADRTYRWDPEHREHQGGPIDAQQPHAEGFMAKSWMAKSFLRVDFVDEPCLRSGTQDSAIPNSPPHDSVETLGLHRTMQADFLTESLDDRIMQTEGDRA
jgi:hypothetical protein